MSQPFGTDKRAVGTSANAFGLTFDGLDPVKYIPSNFVQLENMLAPNVGFPPSKTTKRRLVQPVNAADVILGLQLLNLTMLRNGVFLNAFVEMVGVPPLNTISSSFVQPSNVPCLEFVIFGLPPLNITRSSEVHPTNAD
jgi:hypothetical protein